FRAPARPPAVRSPLGRPDWACTPPTVGSAAAQGGAAPRLTRSPVRTSVAPPCRRAVATPSAAEVAHRPARPTAALHPVAVGGYLWPVPAPDRTERWSRQPAA